MGLGGDVTVLNCHIEHADTHMTLNPVAVNYQCWAARRATAHVAADGTVDFDREAYRADTVKTARRFSNHRLFTVPGLLTSRRRGGSWPRTK